MATSSPSPTPQAQISQKLVVRTAILLFAAAAIVAAFQYYRSVSGDMGGLASSDTSGMVAAIQFHDDGQEAVIIKPDGTIVRNDGWKTGVRDRDITWSPDGNFVYFVSDREQNTPNVMRWSPSQNKVEPRTVGTRGRSNPMFPAQNVPNASQTALITSGGFVLEFNPKDKSTRQVLPPLANEVVQTQDESGDVGGSSGQFSGVYGKYGKSFKVARWMKGKDFIAAIMDANEQQGLQGEVLIVQNMVPNSQGKLFPPAALAAGDKIEFDVSPADGTLVYSVMGFQWPDLDQVPPVFRKGNKILKPFRHLVGLFDPSRKTLSTADLKDQATGGGKTGILVASPEDRGCFASPRFSPDGSSVLFVAGKYDTSGQFTPNVLVVAPAKANAAPEAKPLVRGKVYEPAWSPNGSSIVYARRDKDGKRTIFTLDKDGGAERNVSGSQGDFANPAFSPQVAK